VEPYTVETSVTVVDKSKDPDLPLPTVAPTGDTPLPISHALEYLADALAEQGKTAEAGAVFEKLGQSHDRMRAGYWEFRKRQLVA